MTHEEKIKALDDWLEKRDLTRKDLYKTADVTPVSVRLYLRTEQNTPKEKEFWNKISAITGIDFEKEIKGAVKLPDYVYDCLERYGNTIIGRKYIKKFGKKRILAHLKKKGFDCNMTISESFVEDPSYGCVKDTPTYIFKVKTKRKETNS